MIKEYILKFIIPREIDSLYYEVAIHSYTPQVLTRIDLEIRKQQYRNRIVYSGLANGQVVHQSTLYYYLLLLIQSGIGKLPVIGGSVTLPEYRGLRIYPHILSYIISDAKQYIPTNKIGIIVNPDNQASIRGIERAGFQYVSRIHGYRIGPIFIKHKNRT